MASIPGRREFLRTLTLSSAAMVLPAPPPARAAQPVIEAATLGDGVLLFLGAGCNVLAVPAQDGLVLVDGGAADASSALLEAVARHTGGRPVRTLVNTHWHSDHTGSNEPLGRQGAAIVAHQNTRRWLGSRVYVEQQDRVHPPRPAAALPTRTLTRPETLVAGPMRIQLGVLPPAHTNGDLYAFVPDVNVLMVGDVLSVGRYPAVDYTTGGWIGGLIDAAAELLTVADDRTRIVPGLGPVQSKADLQAQSDMLTVVQDRVWALIRQGKGLREIAQEAPTREFDARWGDSVEFLESTYIGLVRHSRQLGGVL